ncbi:MAG: hypothetical protein R3B67_09635 [Phycisphaerales bacterium]
MSNQKFRAFPALIATLLGGSASLAHAQSFISYQGTLNQAGAPANGTYDMLFTLWDDQNIGAPDNQLGVTNARLGIQVEDGLFNVQLDLGDVDLLTRFGRFLQIQVRPSGVGAYTTLDPRTPIDFSPRLHLLAPNHPPPAGSISRSSSQAHPMSPTAHRSGSASTTSAPPYPPTDQQ